ncbi:GspMb/PilO family protein [Thermomonas sp.]|uniref:GspMb/PilO family protein n=1 Tax=Thermomonas sp. TaxID=1971895 RepID=UPI0035B0918E
MSAILPVRTRKIREEWNGNPRLRWGAGIAIAIGFFYLCLVLADWRRDLHDQYQQRTLQLYKMTELAGQEQWLGRAQSAQALEKALQAEVPNAATIGLAQAEVQTFVRQLINAFGRKLGSDVRPPAEVAGQPGLWRIPVTLRGVVSQPQMLEMLRRVEDSDRLMVVDEFSFTFVRGVPSMSMTLVAYYRVGSGAPKEATDGVR